MNLERLRHVTTFPKKALLRAWEIAWMKCVESAFEFEDSPFDFESAEVYWPTQYGWKNADKWADQIRAGLACHAKVFDQPIPQEKGTGVLALVSFNREEPLPIFFDYSDYPTLQSKWVETGVPYFKMQLPGDDQYPPNVFPGGYVVNDMSIYGLLNHLRMKRLRQQFKFNVYGRFGKGFAFETRSKCLEILRDAGLPMSGGFEFVRYSQFLKEAAVSRICVDLPGNGPLCFRFIDYLALGCCVVAFPQNVKLPAQLIHGEHVMFIRPDMADLPDVVRSLLANPKLCDDLSRNAAEYFDKHIALPSIGAYWLQAAFNYFHRTIDVDIISSKSSALND